MNGKKKIQQMWYTFEHLQSMCENIWITDLLQIAHHGVLVASEYAAEELYDLLVIEVVDTFYNARQEQLHCQVKISMELI